MPCAPHDCWGVSPSHGWFTQLIDLIPAEPVKFCPPGICIGNEEPGDCNHWNGATLSRVPERMGTPAIAGIPEWCYLLFSQRSTELETVRTMGRSVCDMSILTHSFFPSSLTIEIFNKFSTSFSSSLLPSQPESDANQNQICNERTFLNTDTLFSFTVTRCRRSWCLNKDIKA